MKWYLCGPMRGYAQFNFPLFHSAAAYLRDRGYEIINPAEEDSDAVQKEALASTTGQLVDGNIAGETVGEILARDVRLVFDLVGGIIFLPNWHKSTGAKLEAIVGLLCDHKFAMYVPTGDNNRVYDVDSLSILEKVYDNIASKHLAAIAV